jgi:hypothetical protein
VAAIAARSREADTGVDHRVLYRFEARDPEALTPLLEDLGSSPKNDVAPLLSFEDHTPGQGLFRDIAQYEAAVDPTTLPEGETVQSYVGRLKAEGDAMLASRQETGPDSRRLPAGEISACWPMISRPSMTWRGSLMPVRRSPNSRFPWTWPSTRKPLV